MKTISPRRILAAILLLALLLTALPIGILAAEMSFTDVPKSEWYYEDVRLAVEGGLVNGKSPTIYAPNDNVTYAETVKLAACIYKLTDTGSTEFAAGTVWYQPYVDYARSKQIISKDYDWNAAATRAHFMDIFSRAISSNPTLKGTKPLDAINTVEDGAIPDVPMTHPQASSIYKLYRAGVVQGSDKQYSCKPNTNIRRSEVAAILTRMVYADKRLSFTVGDANALRITKQPQNVSGKATNTLKLSVEAAGGKTPYTYRWQVMDEKSSWTWISDETNASFGGHKADTFWATGTYLTKASEKSWKFRCVVTDADGRSVTSEAAGMTLEASTLRIITHPKDDTVSIDETGYVSYQVEASGGKTPYTYRWQRRTADTDWSDLSKTPRSAVEQTINNVDAQVLRISPGAFSSLAERGYAFRCVVTDADGNSVTSNSAAFFVKTEELRITMQPMSVEAAPRDIAEFRIRAAGGRPPYRYQWEVSDDTMGWTWIDTLQDTSMYNDDGKGLLQVQISGYEWKDHVRYRCVVFDADGRSIQTQPAEISEKITQSAGTASLRLSAQQTQVKAENGEVVEFVVTASGGKAPYQYEWTRASIPENGGYLRFFKVDDEDHAGQKTNELSIRVGSEPYYYRCVVTDAEGTSAEMTFTLEIKPRRAMPNRWGSG